MKILQSNYNLNYSELRELIQKININRVASAVSLIIGFAVLCYYLTNVAVVGLALGAVAVSSLRSLQMGIQDINVIFDIEDIIDDLEADWR